MTKLSDRLRKAAKAPNSMHLGDICLQAAFTIERLEKIIADMQGNTNV